MTTYRIKGTAIYTDPVTSAAIAVKDPGVTLEIIVPDGDNSLSYVLEPASAGLPLGAADISLEATSIRLDGDLVGDGTFGADYATITNVSSSAYAITTYLKLFSAGLSHPTHGNVNVEYRFDIGSATAPTINSVAAYEAYEATVYDVSTAGGQFLPGFDIDLNRIRVDRHVEKDKITGTDGDDTYDGGLGRDTIYGKAGNDALFGGKGRDILEGGLGRDHLDGGRSHDILKGGGGGDRLAGQRGG